MVLKELLNKYPIKNIKIGFKDGTGYVYCGKVVRNLNAVVQQTIKKPLETKIDELFKELEKLETSFNRYHNNKLTKSQVRSNITHKIAYYEKKIEEIGNLKVMQRAVEKYYKSLVDKDTLIVLLRGSMAGQFWTIEECEHGGKLPTKPEPKLTLKDLKCKKKEIGKINRKILNNIDGVQKNARRKPKEIIEKDQILMYDKDKCRKCKYHGMTSSNNRMTAITTCYCNYLSITGESCLEKDKYGKAVFDESGIPIDRRGKDKHNCKLYEKGDKIMGKEKISFSIPKSRRDGLYTYIPNYNDTSKVNTTNRWSR